MEDQINRIQRIVSASVDVKQNVLADVSLLARVNEATQLMIEAFQESGSVYWCGNGGSAADAQHLAAELSGRFYFDRAPLSSEALHVNTSYLTAVANDYSYNDIYGRYIKGMGKDTDVLVGISTSGNSENVVRAMEEGKKLGMKIVAFTGEGGGKMKDLADVCINVPSKDTPRIQESHIMIGHIICEIIEDTLFERND
jgi:D-sedoheptulose 7-phosphate isomerase